MSNPKPTTIAQLQQEVDELSRQLSVLHATMTALLEVNYPYREARARQLLCEYKSPKDTP